MPAAAIIAGSVIGAGASIYGANQASGAAKSAAKKGVDAQMAMYTQNRQDLAPWRRQGGRAIGQLGQLFLGNDVQQARAMNRFFTSPQYEFVRDQGIEGLTNSASARGGQLSGNALRGATSFSSGLASGEFNNYVSHLLGIAGAGQGAVNTGVAAGTNAASNVSSLYANAGNQRGSAYMAGASGVNSAIQGGLQNWAFNQYMNPSGGGGTHG